jgi:hypothetical protein
MAAPNPSYSSSAAVTIRLSSDGKNYKDWIKQLTNYAATENAVAVLDGPARPQLYRLVHHDVLREIAMVLRFVGDALEPAPTELGFFGNSPTFGHVRLLHWRCRVAVTTSIHHSNEYLSGDIWQLMQLIWENWSYQNLTFICT